MLRSAGEGSSVRERVKQFEIDRSAEHAGTVEVHQTVPGGRQRDASAWRRTEVSSSRIISLRCESWNRVRSNPVTGRRDG